MARGIVWILLKFDQIWVFALRAPSSIEIPVVSQYQPITEQTHGRMESVLHGS